ACRQSPDPRALELRRRGRARPQQRALAVATHPPVVVDEAHQPGDDPAAEDEPEASEVGPLVVLGRLLHRRPAVGDDVEEQEEQDARGDRHESRLQAHVRAATAAARDAVAQGPAVDEYLETIYFLAFPIGEYLPQRTGSPTLASRVAEMLGVSRASAGEMLKGLGAERRGRGARQTGA